LRRAWALKSPEAQLFGATGLPGYYNIGQGLNLINYVNYGDPVGNYAHDAEFSEHIIDGHHFGVLQFIGSQVSKYDIAFVDKPCLRPLC